MSYEVSFLRSWGGRSLVHYFSILSKDIFSLVQWIFLVVLHCFPIRNCYFDWNSITCKRCMSLTIASSLFCKTMLLIYLLPYYVLKVCHPSSRILISPRNNGLNGCICVLLPIFCLEFIIFVETLLLKVDLLPTRSLPFKGIFSLEKHFVNDFIFYYLVRVNSLHKPCGIHYCLRMSPCFKK